MRCTLLAIGSRGDVQPLFLLGAGLQKAGLEVSCATHEDFVAGAAALGVRAEGVVGES